MNRLDQKENHEYSIGAVAKLTGLTDHTIRAWERRHAAVVAVRASNGRRVYGPEQVEKLGLLKALTQQGVSIGQIAKESVADLRQRARSLNMLANDTMPARVRVAVFGEFLPSQLATHTQALAPLDVQVSDNSRERFAADIKRLTLDVVVVESPVLDAEVLKQMHATLEQAGAARGVLVYSFGRAPDVDLARNSRIVVLRSPASVDEVRAAVIRAYVPEKSVVEAPAAPLNVPSSDWEFSGPVAPRRFSTQQLASLVQASTSIDCECPHHLAQLVGDLNAFEIYSANCENRDGEDAALHRYLHQTTAQARALVEVALERVAKAEGIKY